MSRFFALMLFTSSVFAHPGHGKPGWFHEHPELLLVGVVIGLYFLIRKFK